MSEPISPELVLADPELARAERARLLERDRLQGLAELAARSRLERQAESRAAHVRALEAQVITLRGRVRTLEGEVFALEAEVSAHREAQPSGAVRRRVVSVVLPISLIANAILIAVAIAASRTDQRSTAPPTAADTKRLELGRVAPTPSAGKSRRSKLRTRRAKKAATPKKKAATPKKKSAPPAGRHRTAAIAPTVGAVERKVLAVAVQSPTGKLPPRLINRKTGLAKNGLQAICRRSTLRSFLCIVRPPQHRPSEGVAVRYRVTRDGRGVLTWYRYRSR